MWLIFARLRLAARWRAGRSVRPCLAGSLGLDSGAQPIAPVLGHAVHGGGLRLGDLERVDPGDPRPRAVDAQHQRVRLGRALLEHDLEDAHHEAHRRVVVVVEHHLEARRAKGLRARLLRDAPLAEAFALAARTLRLARHSPEGSNGSARPDRPAAHGAARSSRLLPVSVHRARPATAGPRAAGGPARSAARSRARHASAPPPRASAGTRPGSGRPRRGGSRARPLRAPTRAGRPRARDARAAPPRRSARARATATAARCPTPPRSARWPDRTSPRRW